ncbi:hypothetical protein LINPERPRIM_LOCUS40913 [Linum perenne]
MSQFLR